MPFRIDGISGPAAAKITQAYNMLPPLVDACVQAMTPGSVDWPLYCRWFDAAGASRQANVVHVRTVITRVRDWLQTKTITFANVSGMTMDQRIPGLCAYVWSGTKHMLAGGGLGAMRFEGAEHVGSGVRVLLVPRTTADTRELAATMFHELCHKVGLRVVDNNPSPYDPLTCLNKAQHAPELAIHNAENYTLYFKELNGL